MYPGVPRNREFAAKLWIEASNAHDNKEAMFLSGMVCDVACGPPRRNNLGETTPLYGRRGTRPSRRAAVATPPRRRDDATATPCDASRGAGTATSPPTPRRRRARRSTFTRDARAGSSARHERATRARRTCSRATRERAAWNGTRTRAASTNSRRAPRGDDDPRNYFRVCTPTRHGEVTQQKFTRTRPSGLGRLGN